MKYFLDTNIIIYALNGKYPAILSHFQKIPSMSIVIPSIVLAEIEYGARKSIDYGKTTALYNEFTKVFEAEDFSSKAAVEYGNIRTSLEKKGPVIGANDMLIAATVLAAGGTLVTHNTKEFNRVESLLIEDWTT